MIRLVTSVVVYNPNLDDLSSLFSSYVKSLQVAKAEYDIHDEVVIVDNNPEGDYAEQVEQILKDNGVNYTYVHSPENGGYGHGHNQAIFSTDSDIHLVCNPDIIFEDDTLLVGIKALQEDPNIVLLTPAVFGTDGARHYLCKRNPELFHLFLRRFAPDVVKNALFKGYLDRYEYKDHSYDDPIENLPFCTGCFMLFRTSVLKEIKGFDEGFFMYLEDADITRRALARGKTLYLPTFKVVHKWERGSYKSAVLRNAAIKSAFYYARKWFLR